ncbi:uncharacterized protein CPUR_02539 [Claviceps purpurea 20.1]|uniref:Methyltransferase n=1 Tax=Claviceps purpurea (strain 20.1) TaxID=1111077 RepID=M1W3W1_CLAP2|nr:uncharacterized protein CPUR_02539 [Claviceps purpurea 20.1]
MSTAHANTQGPFSTSDDLIAAENIPVNDQDEIDSIFSEDKSSTTSIASSVLEYRQIHGRTYHSDKFTANYFLPNDDQQLGTEELCHHCLTILLDDRLFLAPLEKDKIHRVLDVGTGFGIWAIEFADQFPNASVVGTDLSPCQPQWVPPNLCFEIDDATLDWTWNANHFDFIHMRCIVGGIEDWTAFFKEAYRCCAPGGWVPVGPWAKDRKFAEVGRVAREAAGNDLEGYTQMLWQSVQRPEDEYHVWLATLRKAIRNPKVHSYMMVQVVYGRKPE